MSKRWLKYIIFFLWLFAWDYGSDIFIDTPRDKYDFLIRLPLELAGVLLILYLFRTKETKASDKV
ncbi:hypothetical protein AALF16_24170 [Bacillus cereus]|uniref:hypothetical protein n=1 Tax=Bacillus cereus TaxID=1396 RepID=UPI003570899B